MSARRCDITQQNNVLFPDAVPSSRRPVAGGLARLLLWAGLLLAVPAHAEERLAEIRFVGNEVTRPEILLQEMSIHVGDVVDLARIEESRQAMMDLGLFKRVDAEVLPGEAGAVAQFTVAEKHYVLPLPRLNRNADGDISYGVQLRLDNLGGLNQRLRVTFENENPADGDEDRQELRAEYHYARVAGTPFSLDVDAANLRQELVVETGGAETARYQYDARSMGFLVSRFLNVEGPSRGWRVGGGLVFSHNVFEHLEGMSGLYDNSSSTAIHGVAAYTDLRDLLYSRAGVSYGYDVLVQIPDSWDMHDPALHRFYYRRYLPIADLPHHNFNMQLQLGFSHEYEGEPYALGGSTTLRGYPRNSVVGRSFVLANFEYLAPLPGTRSLRGGVFLDVGNAYPSSRGIDLTDLKTSIGVGLRWRLKSFVDISLNVDFAYAINEAESKTYASTKDAF
jgi:outer membrane protein assembly factor BamA